MIVSDLYRLPSRLEPSDRDGGTVAHKATFLANIRCSCSAATTTRRSPLGSPQEAAAAIFAALNYLKREAEDVGFAELAELIRQATAKAAGEARLGR